MKFLRFGVCFIGINALLLGILSNKAAAFKIDFFDEQQFAGSSSATNGTFTDNSVTGRENIFGGDRFLSTTFSGGSGSPFTNNGIGIFNGQALITAEPGASVSGYIEWNGISDSGSSIDLTDSGVSDSIRLDVSNVSETIDLEFIVEDADGTVGALTKNIFDESIGDYYYSFNDFSSSGGTTEGLDFTTIDRVRMGTNGEVPNNFDGTFALVESAAQPVPFEFSPSLGLVFCGGLFGLNKLRKRISLKTKAQE